ncbi:Putative pterin-4-alpha-carbinolamine dehydratase (PHS) [Rickettsia akari str. Hartford]|uniref:4a-hydroxytetrahydrobiopterin dehydratase n=1 Tax=Rickettsia akari (strain Hartford) TaxID=293614 RepID=A8GMN2_RICAH|nr:Putative pterin-4-alpha-carbinolamine dehydratase (PHS) [Rickettsia akari str. Hartford]
MNEVWNLYKKYKFLMEFANKITEIAEQEAHHPDFTISWGASTV